MKKNLLLIIAAAAVIISGCARNDHPKEVADNFVDAYLVDYNPEKFKKYTSTDLSNDIQNEIIYVKDQNEGFYEALKKDFKNMKFRYIYNAAESTVNGNNAQMVYDVTSGLDPVFNEKFYVDLYRNNKKWEVTNFDFTMY